MEASKVIGRLELLVGAKEPNDGLGDRSYFRNLCLRFPSLTDLSPDELDQLLLAAGYNRPSGGFHEYFRELSGPTYDFDRSLSRWREVCMRRFGNFRYPYREYSSSNLETLRATFGARPRDVSSRGASPMAHVEAIPPGDTPFLGYLAGRKVREIELRRDAGETLTSHEEALLRRFSEARERAKHNTYEYCTMPHMDVYVATSMRTSEDFLAVNRFTGELFGNKKLRKVAYFDPTQSDHPDRIVKGIIEGLMLRRAAATVYLAQEKETLGKDSELAATLAQGKVVIAYVPKIEDVDALSAQLREDALASASFDTPSPGEDEARGRILERMKAIDPETWFSFESALSGGGGVSLDETSHALAQRLRLHYENKASTLKSTHPLGLQVHQETGVANGILVARSIEECRELVYEIIEDRLEFEIVARSHDGEEERDDLEAPTDWDRMLIEKRTRSVHRVVVGDEIILNSFWNWYKGPEKG